MLLRENETKEPSTIETTYQMLNVKFVLNVTGLQNIKCGKNNCY